MRAEGDEGPRRPGDGQPGPSVDDLKAAYRQATRTATRAAILGALGFGAALLMLMLIAERGPTPAPTRYSLEHMLILGGVVGGVLFTMIAVRASRTAKSCQERLERRAR